MERKFIRRNYNGNFERYNNFWDIKCRRLSHSRGGGLKDFIIERGQKDGWYYTIYKSGWKECSKKCSTTSDPYDRYILPVEFSNTDYIILVTLGNTKAGQSGYSGNYPGAYAYSKSVVHIDKNTHTYPYFVECKGY